MADDLERACEAYVRAFRADIEATVRRARAAGALHSLDRKAAGSFAATRAIIHADRCAADCIRTSRARDVAGDAFHAAVMVETGGGR